MAESTTLLIHYPNILAHTFTQTLLGFTNTKYIGMAESVSFEMAESVSFEMAEGGSFGMA
jgi:hypothetical protein